MVHKSAISKRQLHVLATSKRKKHPSSIIKTMRNRLNRRPSPIHLLLLLVQIHNIKEKYQKAIC